MTEKQLSDLIDKGESIPTSLLYSQTLLMHCETHAWLKNITQRLLEMDKSVINEEAEYTHIMKDVDETARGLYNQHMALLMSKGE